MSPHSESPSCASGDAPPCASAVAVPRAETPGAVLARFQELRGRRVFEGAGSLWGQLRGRLYISLPYHVRIDPHHDELAQALRSAGAAAVRYPTSRRGMPAVLNWCRARGYSIESVHPKGRADVKKGLARCHIRPLDPDELRATGMELNLQTLARQRRFDPELGEPRGWRRLVQAVRDCPGAFATGAFFNERLSTYSICVRDSDCLNVIHRMSRTEDLPQGASYALDFHLLQEASRDATITGVANGFGSLAGDDGLQLYKRKLGYDPISVDVGVQLHPLLEAPLTSRVAVGIAEALARLPRTGSRFATIAGALRCAGAAS